MWQNTANQLIVILFPLLPVVDGEMKFAEGLKEWSWDSIANYQAFNTSLQDDIILSSGARHYK